MLFFKSPLEVLQKQSPDVSHLRVFDCICFVFIQASNRDKLDPRAAKCIFLGYSSTKKGYKCYHPHSRKLFISRDVQFEETIPYYGEISQQTSSKDIFPLPYPAPADTVSPSTLPLATSNTPSSTTDVPSGTESFGQIISESEKDHELSEPNANSGSSIPVSTTDPSSSSKAVNHANSGGSISISTAGPSSSTRVVNPIMANPEGDSLNEQSRLETHVIPLPQTRKTPVRNRAPPIKMQDFVTFAARHPISNSLTYQQLSSDHTSFLSTISNVREPRHFQEANTQDEWKCAMSDELLALAQNQT